MPDKTPFQIQQAGNDETLSATVIEMMEPEDADRLIKHLQELGHPRKEHGA